MGGMSWIVRASALAAVLVALVGLPAAGQETTGTITGNVLDASGGALPGATVTLTHVATGRAWEVVSTETGRYTAALLPPGEYRITATLAGFRTAALTGIRVSVNDRLEIDLTLAVGGVTETVEVTAESPLVQPISAVQGLVGSEQVQELPINNRSFLQLATLVPGVSSDLGDEVNFGLTNVVSVSINGARRNAVNWLVDGASNVDVGSNITLLSTPTLESIQEFRIITSSYAAEWPRSGGGVVNVVTRGGSRRFSGSLYEFVRNDALNANSFFRHLSPNPAINSKPPYLRYHNFGYTVGGPALPSREKLYFFWSEEWRRIRRAPGTLTATVPTPAWLTDPSSPNYVAPEDRDPIAVRLMEAWPAPNVGTNRFVNVNPNINNTRQETVRVDFDLNRRWRVTGRYTHDLSQTRELGGLFFGIVVPNVATTDTSVPGNVASMSLRTIAGQRALNELKYQFSGNTISTKKPEGTRNTKDEFGISNRELFAQNNGSRIPIIRVLGLATFGATQPIRIEYRNHTFTDDFTWMRGNHAFKTGVVLTFEQKNENAANTTQGDFTFNAGGGFSAFQNFLRGNRDGACGTPCTYSEAEIDITNHLRFNRYEMYAQDTWKIRRNLTLDYGVRYSLYPPVVDRDNVLDTFAPSAYDPRRAPAFANAAGTLVVLGTGDRLNGIHVAGQNSPHGRAIYPFDKNNVMPRGGVSWDPFGNGRTIVRSGYGVYYDQPLIGIFEQNAFVNPQIGRAHV